MHHVSSASSPAHVADDSSDDEQQDEDSTHVPGKRTGHEHHCPMQLFARTHICRFHTVAMVIASMPGLPTERVVQVEASLPEPRALQDGEERSALRHQHVVFISHLCNGSHHGSVDRVEQQSVQEDVYVLAAKQMKPEEDGFRQISQSQSDVEDVIASRCYEG